MTQYQLDYAAALRWVIGNTGLRDSESRKAFARFYARTARKRLAWVSDREDVSQFFTAYENGIEP